MKVIEKLYVTNRDDWRVWLEQHHATKKEVWLICYKKHTGKPSIPYDVAVEEALCFGWIDSIVKRVDDEKFVRKFTPRKGRSKWSETNKKRARRMLKAGRMTKTGLERIDDAKSTGEWLRTAPPQTELEVPKFILSALTANKKAHDNFNALAKGYKRQLVGWIASAKREETRRRRLAEAIQLLEKNKKLGMK
ncbi:MAG: YdeI/OmpD-associated family protein [Candidatus Bathyarchaeota archaeon]|nr:MAG: YdeI/OmpD-associated family protein [Candidatus Bathyarchaeota archaeon]